MKEIFKSAATRAAVAGEPFYDFYAGFAGQG